MQVSIHETYKDVSIRLHTLIPGSPDFLAFWRVLLRESPDLVQGMAKQALHLIEIPTDPVDAGGPQDAAAQP